MAENNAEEVAIKSEREQRDAIVLARATEFVGKTHDMPVPAESASPQEKSKYQIRTEQASAVNTFLESTNGSLTKQVDGILGAGQANVEGLPMEGIRNMLDDEQLVIEAKLGGVTKAQGLLAKNDDAIKELAPAGSDTAYLQLVQDYRKILKDKEVIQKNSSDYFFPSSKSRNEGRKKSGQGFDFSEGTAAHRRILLEAKVIADDPLRASKKSGEEGQQENFLKALDAMEHRRMYVPENTVTPQIVAPRVEAQRSDMSTQIAQIVPEAARTALKTMSSSNQQKVYTENESSKAEEPSAEMGEQQESGLKEQIEAIVQMMYELKDKGIEFWDKVDARLEQLANLDIPGASLAAEILRTEIRAMRVAEPIPQQGVNISDRIAQTLHNVVAAMKTQGEVAAKLVVPEAAAATKIINAFLKGVEHSMSVPKPKTDVQQAPSVGLSSAGMKLEPKDAIDVVSVTNSNTSPPKESSIEPAQQSYGSKLKPTTSSGPPNSSSRPPNPSSGSPNSSSRPPNYSSGQPNPSRLNGEPKGISQSDPTASESFVVGIDNQMEDVEKRARELATKRVQELQNINKEEKNIFKKIAGVRHRLFGERYRQMYIKEARDLMIKHGTTAIDVTGNSTFVLATEDIARFQRDREAVAETLAMRAENKIDTGSAKEKWQMAEGDTRTFIMDQIFAKVVNGVIPTEADLQKHLATLVKGVAEGSVAVSDRTRSDLLAMFGKNQNISGKTSEAFASNIMLMAEKVKVSHAFKEKGLAAVADRVKFVIGKSAYGAQTEASFNTFDKVLMKMNQSRIGSVFGNHPIFTAATVGAMTTITRSLVGKGANLIFPVVGGAVVGGAVAGLQKGFELKSDRMSHQADTAYGGKFEEGAKNRTEMDKYISKMVSASELINGGTVDSSGNKSKGINELMRADLKVDANQKALMGIMAEIQARMEFSVQNKVDLIKFDSRSSVGQGRLELTRALVAGRKALESAGVPADQLSRAAIETMLGVDLTEKFVIEKKLSDDEFNKFKNKEIAKRFLLSAGMGLGVGTAIGFAREFGVFDRAYAAIGLQNNPIADGAREVGFAVSPSTKVGEIAVGKHMQGFFDGGPRAIGQFMGDLRGNDLHLHLAGQQDTILHLVNGKIDLSGQAKPVVDALRQSGFNITETSHANVFFDNSAKTFTPKNIGGIGGITVNTPDGLTWIQDPLGGFNLVDKQDATKVIMKGVKFAKDAQGGWTINNSDIVNFPGQTASIFTEQMPRTQFVNIRGPGGEWLKHAEKLTHIDWYANNTQHSDFNELHLYTRKFGRKLILDMSTMKPGESFQQGLPAVDVPDVIKKGNAAFSFFLPGLKEPIIVPADVFGHLTLDPDDMKTMVKFPNGTELPMGTFTKMVINAQELLKQKDGDIATELNGLQSIFRLAGDDGKGTGIISAGRLISGAKGSEWHSFAAIRGNGSPGDTLIIDGIDTRPRIEIPTLANEVKEIIAELPKAEEVIDKRNLVIGYTPIPFLTDPLERLKDEEKSGTRNTLAPPFVSGSPGPVSGISSGPIPTSGISNTPRSTSGFSRSPESTSVPTGRSTNISSSESSISHSPITSISRLQENLSTLDLGSPTSGGRKIDSPLQHERADDSPEAIKKRFSQRLIENPQANLEYLTEVQEYISSQSPEYKLELARLMSQQGMSEKMNDECEAIVCMPVYTFGEGKIIGKTLEKYLEQVDVTHNKSAVDAKKLEVIIYLNHPKGKREELEARLGKSYTEGAEDRVKSGVPTEYDTEEAIRQFKMAHPEIAIRVMTQEFPQRELWGSLTKRLYDVALARSLQRGDLPNRKDPSIITNDADLIHISPAYIKTILEEMEGNENNAKANGNIRKIDAISGKMDLAQEVYAKVPELLFSWRLRQIRDLKVKRVDLYGANSIIRASSYAAIGGVCSDLDCGSDGFMSYQLALARDRNGLIPYNSRAWLQTDPRRQIKTFLNGNPQADTWADWSKMDVYDADWQSQLNNIPNRSIDSLDPRMLENEINQYFTNWYGGFDEGFKFSMTQLGLMTKEQYQDALNEAQKKGRDEVEKEIKFLGLSQGDYHYSDSGQIIIDRNDYDYDKNTKKITLRNIETVKARLKAYVEEERWNVTLRKEAEARGSENAPDYSAKLEAAANVKTPVKVESNASIELDTSKLRETNQVIADRLIATLRTTNAQTTGAKGQLRKYNSEFGTEASIAENGYFATSLFDTLNKRYGTQGIVHVEGAHANAILSMPQLIEGKWKMKVWEPFVSKHGTDNRGEYKLLDLKGDYSGLLRADGTVDLTQKNSKGKNYLQLLWEDGAHVGASSGSILDSITDGSFKPAEYDLTKVFESPEIATVRDMLENTKLQGLQSNAQDCVPYSWYVSMLLQSMQPDGAKYAMTSEGRAKFEKEFNVRLLKKKDFLKDKSATETRATFANHTELRLPLSTEAQQVWKDVVEKAEKKERTYAEYQQVLIDAGKAIETLQKPGTIKKTIAETLKNPDAKEVLMDGRVVFIPKLNADIISVGDIHGSLETVKRVLEKFDIINRLVTKSEPQPVLVFQGDVMHRGADDIPALEVIAKLISLYPKNVLLLQGNHDVSGGTSDHYKMSETSKIKARFGATVHHNKAWKEFGTNLFDKLPKMVAVGNGALIVHAVPAITSRDLAEASAVQTVSKDPNSKLAAVDSDMFMWGDIGYNSPAESLNANLKELSTIDIEAMIKSAEQKGLKTVDINYEGLGTLTLDQARVVSALFSAAYNNELTINTNRFGGSLQLKGSMDATKPEYKDFIIDLAKNLISGSMMSAAICIGLNKRGIENVLQRYGGSVLIRGHQTNHEMVIGKSVTMNLQNTSLDVDSSVIVMPANTAVSIADFSPGEKSLNGAKYRTRGKYIRLLRNDSNTTQNKVEPSPKMTVQNAAKVEAQVTLPNASETVSLSLQVMLTKLGVVTQLNQVPEKLKAIMKESFDKSTKGVELS